jgi:hypothetical protein
MSSIEKTERQAPVTLLVPALFDFCKKQKVRYLQHSGKATPHFEISTGRLFEGRRCEISQSKEAAF